MGKELTDDDINNMPDDDIDNLEEPNEPEPPKEETPEPEEKDHRIPHARFEEVNQQRKEAMKEAENLRLALARMEAKVEALAALQEDDEEEGPEPPDFDFDEAEDRLDKALIEMDAVSKIRREIRVARRQENAYKAWKEQQTQVEIQNEIKKSMDNSATIMRAERAAAKVWAEYPFLNHNEEGHDRELINLVISMRNTMINEGADPADAILEAGRTVGKKFAAMYASGEPEGTSKDAISAATRRAVEKGVNVNSRQPPKPDEWLPQSRNPLNRRPPMAVPQRRTSPSRKRMRRSHDALRETQRIRCERTGAWRVHL